MERSTSIGGVEPLMVRATCPCSPPETGPRAGRSARRGQPWLRSTVPQPRRRLADGVVAADRHRDVVHVPRSVSRPEPRPTYRNPPRSSSMGGRRRAPAEDVHAVGRPVRQLQQRRIIPSMTIAWFERGRVARRVDLVRSDRLGLAHQVRRVAERRVQVRQRRVGARQVLQPLRRIQPVLQHAHQPALIAFRWNRLIALFDASCDCTLSRSTFVLVRLLRNSLDAMRKHAGQVGGDRRHLFTSNGLGGGLQTGVPSRLFTGLSAGMGTRELLALRLLSTVPRSATAASASSRPPPR